MSKPWVSDLLRGEERLMSKCVVCGRGTERNHCWPCMAEENRVLREMLADVQELAAMYLQCLNSRSLERGETVEQVAAFCQQEFAENPWLKDAYEKLATREAEVRAFCLQAGLFRT